MPFYVNEKDIYLIIKYLSPKKVQVCGNISIKMIQVCGKTITAPLRIIFEESLRKMIKITDMRGVSLDIKTLKL